MGSCGWSESLFVFAVLFCLAMPLTEKACVRSQMRPQYTHNLGMLAAVELARMARLVADRSVMWPARPDSVPPPSGTAATVKMPELEKGRDN